MFVLRFRKKLADAGLALFLAFVLAGCATPETVDLSAPEWTVREGQAVWKMTPDAAGVAGDLLVATGRDGRSFVQFSKTPLPIVTAERSGRGWRVTSAGENRTYRGRGAPPDRILWLQLPTALNASLGAASEIPGDWTLKWVSPDSWRFEHRTTGESLDGYLTVVRPTIHP